MSAISRTPLCTVPVPTCPVCGDEGIIRFSGVRDPLHYAGGQWTYRSCTVCDCLWLSPRPGPESVQSIYPPSYYTHDALPDYFGALFEQRQNRLSRLRLEGKRAVLRHSYSYPLSSLGCLPMSISRAVSYAAPIRRLVGYTVRFIPGPPGTLLEVGCGNGAFLRFMSRLGWEVWGIEPDQVASRLAMQAGLNVIAQPLEAVSLDPESFDAITLNHVLEHLPNPAETLRVLATALRPGGTLVSISPNPRGLLVRVFGSAWRGLEPPRHFVLPGPRALRRALQPMGLDAQTWTSWRSADWVIRQSAGLRWRGDPQAFEVGRFWNLVHSAAWGATAMMCGLGDEVVLVARKGPRQ